MPLKVLLLRNVNLKAVIKAMFKVGVLIDLGCTSCLKRKLDNHIPKPNGVPLCPNETPRPVVVLAAQLHGY
jgi:hypothetical protein